MLNNHVDYVDGEKKSNDEDNDLDEAIHFVKYIKYIFLFSFPYKIIITRK